MPIIEILINVFLSIYHVLVTMPTNWKYLVVFSDALRNVGDSRNPAEFTLGVLLVNSFCLSEEAQHALETPGIDHKNISRKRDVNSGKFAVSCFDGNDHSTFSVDLNDFSCGFDHH